jgi:hypothetical protein
MPVTGTEQFELMKLQACTTTWARGEVGACAVLLHCHGSLITSVGESGMSSMSAQAPNKPGAIANMARTRRGEIDFKKGMTHRSKRRS